MNLTKIISSTALKGALVLTLFLTLSACQDDALLTNNTPDSPVQEFVRATGPKELYTASIRLAMPEEAPSRAGYEDGSGTESEIKNVLILFYDENGNYLANFNSETMIKVPNGADIGDIPRVEVIKWNAELPVTFEMFAEYEEKVHKLFAIVNYDNELLGKLIDHEEAITDENGETLTETIYRDLEDLPDIKVSAYQTSKGFLMSTPGHYNADNQYTICQEIDQAARPQRSILIDYLNLELEPIDVFVERLAARVDISVAPKGIQDVQVVYGRRIYNLKFNPQKFGLEALEDKSYIAKHLDNFSGDAENYPSDFSYWIRSDFNLRTFWANSPSFYEDDLDYPSIGQPGDYDLKYTSFESLSGITLNGNTNKYTGSGYLLEHTFHNTELTREGVKNPYAVPSSIVVEGVYKATYSGEDYSPDPDFFHQTGATDDDEEDDGDDDDDDLLDEEEEVEAVDTDAPELASFVGSGEGFYIRRIDIERDNSQKDPDSGYENQSPYDNLKYRLYLKNEKKNELLDSMLREQYVIFRNDPYTDKYKALKHSKFEYEGKTYDLADIFEIKNTWQRYYNKEFIPAPNAYTLQLKDNWEEIWNNYNALYRTKRIGQLTEEWVARRRAELVDLNNKQTDESKKLTEEEIEAQVQNEKHNQVAKIEASTPMLPLGELCYGVYDYDEASGAYYPISSDNDEETANERLQIQLGHTNFFSQGRGFFYSPVPHHYSTSGFNGMFNYKRTLLENGNGFSRVPDHLTGEFGIVRNHIYNFTIDNIANLAYGRPDGTNLIPLPDPEFDDKIYQFSINIEILPWHIFSYTFNIGDKDSY